MTPKARIKKLEEKLETAEPVIIQVYWGDEPLPEPSPGDKIIILNWGDATKDDAPDSSGIIRAE